MVLPVQVAGPQIETAEADREIRFAGSEAGVDDRWVWPGDLEALLERNPAINVPLDQLDAGAFLVREVVRVGDPLFGYLRRLHGITDAPVALIPIQARLDPGTASWELATAVIDARGGRVLWFGRVRGASEPSGGLASAAAELMATLVPSGS